MTRQIDRRPCATISITCLLFFMLVTSPVAAQIDPTAFPCDGTAFNVQKQEAELLRFYEFGMGFIFEPVGPNLDFCCEFNEQCRLTDPNTLGAIEVNAMGFRRTDGMLYALELTDTNSPMPGDSPGNNGIIMIDNQGDVTRVPSMGLPSSPGTARFDAGDVSTDGTTMFVNQAGNSPLWVIDLTVSPAVATSVALSGPSGIVNDWAYNPDDGNLYGGAQEGNLVVQLNPTTGERTSFAVAGLPSGESFGGAWFESSGNLFLYRNQSNDPGLDCDLFTPTTLSGTLYEITLDLMAETGSIQREVSGLFTEGRNDGAACVAMPPFIGAAKIMTADPKGAVPSTVTIQYVFENFGTASPGDDMTDLSAIDDLEFVFGQVGSDWTFTSITSNPIDFHNVNFDGIPGMGDPELINQTAPSNNLAAGDIKTITVVIELLTLDAGIETPPNSGTFEFCNQINVQALNGLGELIGDVSFGGGDPDPDGNNIPDEQGASCIQFSPGPPCLDIIKTGTLDAGPDGIPTPGDVIDYTLDVSNCGSVDLFDVMVTDPLIPTISCPPGNPIPSLPVGAVETCTGEYTITQMDIDNGERCNTASAEGTDPTGAPVGPASDEHCEPLPVPEIQLTKVGTLDDGGDGANPGDVITYTFLVENIGNVTVTDIVVSDPLVSPIICPSGNPIPSLDPGESEVCMGTYVVTQMDIDNGERCNTAAAEGSSPTGAPVGPVTDEHCEPLGPVPCIDLLKEGVLDDGGDNVPDVGDVIDYFFTVTNCGNVTLTDVAVTDPLVDPIDCNGDDVPPQIASLVPGEMETCIGSYLVTQDDLDAGERCNIANAIGTEPAGGTVDDDGEVCVPLMGRPPEIPTLGHFGLMLLALGIAGLGVRRLRLTP